MSLVIASSYIKSMRHKAQINLYEFTTAMLIRALHGLQIQALARPVSGSLSELPAWVIPEPFFSPLLTKQLIGYYCFSY